MNRDVSDQRALPSAAPLTVRRLWMVDYPYLLAHFKALDGEGRHRRFAGAVSDAFIESHVSTLLQMGRIAYGAYSRETLCAVGELCADTRDTAEIAFSVLPGYRQTGLSTMLMNRMITAASNRGITKLLLMCVSDNGAMQQLARKFGATLEHCGGECWGVILPPKPSAISAFEETFRDVSGLMQATVLWPLQLFAAPRAQVANATPAARRRHTA